VKEVRVSVTELDNYGDCSMKWYYANKLGLRPKAEEAGVSYTLSGSAIHFGLEAGLMRSPKSLNPTTVALSAAMAYLESHGAGSERYRKGAEKALLGVPQKYWDTEEFMSEDKLEILYHYEGYDITMVGIPDIWFYDGDGALVIVDAKSSGKDEADRAMAYQMWNMQPHYYAVLLEDYLLGKGLDVPPILVKHDILSTRGKHFYGAPLLVGKKHREKMRQRMLKRAGEIAVLHGEEMNVFTHGKLSYMCKMCDFADLDTLALTGRDIQSMVEEQYTTREQRER
jgi:hypothetical protein